MKRSCILAMAVWSGLAWSGAQAAEEGMKQVLAQWQQQMAEYEAALSIATTDEQRASIPPPVAADLAPALWKTVRAQTGAREVLQANNPISPTRGNAGGADEVGVTRTVKTYEFEQPWAAPAVIWFINHPEALTALYAQDSKQLGSLAQSLLNSVYRVHFESPQIGQICPTLAQSTSPQAHAIAEKIFERNTDPSARACAALALSIMLANPTAAEAEGGYARARSKRVYYLRQALNLAPKDTLFGAHTLTRVAEEQVYQLRNLTVGTIPPRFSVTAPDGKQATFPTTGKPNLIIFWSPGEDVGLSIMSKLHSLTSTYPGLELCPIVPHGDEEEWKRMLQENGISTCYMDNEQGTAGTSYRVSQLPFVVLTSDRAAILYIGYPGMQLQTALDSYFSAAPARPAPQAEEAPHSDTPPALRPMPQF